MDDLATAILEGTSIARLKALLDSELERGARELGQKRSGYEQPVIVAVAPGDGTLRAVAPAPRALRADPDAVNERTWLLVAALVGALVEVAGADTVRAGHLGGQLALAVPGDPDDAELVPLAFETQVEGIDRLRARALAVPASVLADVDDLRDPIGAAHPLRVAAHVAAPGGRPRPPPPPAGAPRRPRLHGGARGRRPRRPRRHCRRRPPPRRPGSRPPRGAAHPPAPGRDGQVGRLSHGFRPSGAWLRR